MSQCFLLCPDCRNSVPKFFCYVLKLGISWAKNGKNGSQIEAPVPMAFLICPEGNILSQSLLVMSQSWAFFGPKIASLGLKLRWVSQWYFVNVQKVEKLSQSFFCYVPKLAIFWTKNGTNGSQSEVRVPMTFILSPKCSRFCPN